MDFWDLTKLLFRRWRISLPLLLVSIAAAGYTAVTVKPDYVMTSYIQLVPLSTGVQTNNQTTSLSNPFTVTGLAQFAQAGIYATQDQRFLDELEAQGHSTDFSLVMTLPDPIVTVQVVAKTPADAISTTNVVLDKFQSTIRDRQKRLGVQDRDLIATDRLDSGENVKPSGGKQKRALAAIAAVGLMLTTGITLLVDVLARRRAARRDRAAALDGAAATARAGPPESAKLDDVPDTTPKPLVNGAAAAPSSGTGGTANGSRAVVLPRAAGPANGHEAVLLPRAGPPADPNATAVLRITGLPADPNDTAVIRIGGAPADPNDTVILPRTQVQERDPADPRTEGSAEPQPPARQHRGWSMRGPRQQAGAYRTKDADGEAGSAPADGMGPPESVPSDVTIVLRTDRSSGEHSGERP